MVELSPGAHKIHVVSGLLVAVAIFIALVAIPLYSKPPLSQLQQIQQRGTLKILTLNAASTYYLGDNGPDGFEYQLSRMFAEYLGVKPQIIVVERFAELYPELTFGSGDIIAAGVSEQDDVSHRYIQYGPGYHQVTQQLLYRKILHDRPKSLGDIKNGVIEVIEGSSEQRLLKRLSKNYPDLSWNIVKDIAIEELIELVDQGLVDYLLADSHEIALQRRFFPELRIAFELGEAKQLRWAVKSGEDSSLLLAMRDFFAEVKKDGRLEQLIHRYYSHVARFNYSDLQTFTLHSKERLPKYRDIFEREAAKVGLDWKLLAAIGYQESLWNPKAKSPTGVRGLMMLTRNTAKQVKIKNRLDPEQSIIGGARYFKRVLKKIPERIKNPDRLWLALASYNIGYGHLEDARRITQQMKDDPDKWIDVKKYLPLLSRKKWYKNTKHGYARGSEPVKYVENIRKYYDLLSWMELKQDEQNHTEEDTTESAKEAVEELTIPPSL